MANITKTSKEYWNHLHTAAPIVLKSAGVPRITDIGSMNSFAGRVKQDLAYISHVVNDLLLPFTKAGCSKPEFNDDIGQISISSLTLQVNPPLETGFGTGSIDGPECFWVWDGLPGGGGRSASIYEALMCLDEKIHNVKQIIEYMVKFWGSGNIRINKKNKFYEQKNLQLDIKKAKTKLKWYPTYSVKRGVQITTEWYREVFKNKKDPFEVTNKQIREYMNENNWR